MPCMLPIQASHASFKMLLCITNTYPRSSDDEEGVDGALEEDGAAVALEDDDAVEVDDGVGEAALTNKLALTAGTDETDEELLIVQVL